jgi:hypothetical protein
MAGMWASFPSLRVDLAQRGCEPRGTGCNAHGDIEIMVAVRVGPVWTDSVAIAGEDQTLAMRHRTRESALIVPAELPGESSAVWRRHGRCEDVLAELFELP